MLYFLNCHKTEEAYALRKGVFNPVAYIGGPKYFYGIVIQDEILYPTPASENIKHLTFKDRVFYNGDEWEPA